MVNRGMNLKLLKKMKQAGCYFLCYGVESFSDKILKSMNKFYNSSDAERVIRLSHEAGINTAVNVIVGFPGETEEDFNKTIGTIKKNKGNLSEVTNVSSFAVMPDSKVGANLEEYGVNIFDLTKDINFYIDNNNVGPEERIKRVRKATFMLSKCGIRNPIVNQAGFREPERKNSVALLLIPPIKKINIPSLKIARIYSYLQKRNLSPIVYDLNIKFYNSVEKDFKMLWDYQNWPLWINPFNMLDSSGLLAEKMFGFINEIISLKTKVFCFFITGENFTLSVKIAELLKKWAPWLFLVFVNSMFKEKEMLKTVPKKLVDIFVVDQEEKALYEILKKINGDLSNITNTAIYKNNIYAYKSEEPGEREDIIADFNGFELGEYKDLRLPIFLDKS